MSTQSNRSMSAPAGDGAQHDDGRSLRAPAGPDSTELVYIPPTAAHFESRGTYPREEETGPVWWFLAAFFGLGEICLFGITLVAVIILTMIGAYIEACRAWLWPRRAR